MDVNEEPYIGSVPLSCACANGHERCVRLLLEAGADVNSQENEGQTALVNATERGHKSCVDLLIKAGAKDLL